MKKKKKKIGKLIRMSKQTWDAMRNRGGAHGTKKGKRGYNRKKIKGEGY